MRRVNNWVTDPDHNRVLPILIFWTAICLFVTVAYFKADQPEFGAIWAFFGLMAVINTFREMFQR